MTYLKLTNGRHLLILEPANLARLQGGEPCVSPNKEVMVAYTPDIVWLTQQLMKKEFSFSPKELDDVLAEGLKHEPVMRTSAELLEQINVFKRRSDA